MSMIIQMTRPSSFEITVASSFLPEPGCPASVVIDRDAGAMLERAILADHLLLESAELGYLEAQAVNLIAAARTTCSVRRA